MTSFNNQLQILKALLFTCIGVLFVSETSAQVNFGLDSKYIYGFPQRDFIFVNEHFDTKSAHGYGLNGLVYIKQKQWNYSIPLKVGGKFLETRGDNFNAQTTRLHVSFGLQYEILEELKAECLFGLENNRDFEEFRSQTTDLFRYQLELGANYTFCPKLDLVIQYVYAVYPGAGVYLVFNPRHQIGIGANIFILR